MTNKLSETSIAALDAAGVDTDDVAIWLRDAIIDNYNNNTSSTMTLAEDWSEWGGIGGVIASYSDGPYADSLWAEIWNDDVIAVVGAELDLMMRKRIVDDFGDRIHSAESLDELRRVLNEADAWAEDINIDVEEIYAATDLPTFGGADINDTDGIFSWDETRQLMSTIGDWIIEPRADLEAA